MEQTGIHCLPTLLKRLEAVAARLEDIALSTGLETNPAALLRSEESFRNSAAIVGKVVEPGKISQLDAPAEVPKTVACFDKFLRDVVGAFCDISQEIEGVVAKQAAELQKGFNAQRRFIVATSRAKKPDVSATGQTALQQLLRPIEEAIRACQTIQQENRGTPAFVMLSAVADGAFVLTWVSVEAKPGKRVEDSYAMAQYFGNKVMKNADRHLLHWKWAEALFAIFRELEIFIKDEYPYGIVWSGDSDDLSVVLSTL